MGALGGPIVDAFETGASAPAAGVGEAGGAGGVAAEETGAEPGPADRGLCTPPVGCWLKAP